MPCGARVDDEEPPGEETGLEGIPLGVLVAEPVCADCAELMLLEEGIVFGVEIGGLGYGPAAYAGIVLGDGAVFGAEEIYGAATLGEGPRDPVLVTDEYGAPRTVPADDTWVAEVYKHP